MKKGRVAVWCLAVLAVLLVSSAGYAEERKFRIEVLQVTDIGPFQASLTGFVSELQKNGLVQGKNLEIRRTVIDFDVEKAGLWSKVGVLLRITGEAQKIADRKPDLVLTIGTPATKYAKDRIIKAGIPLVLPASPSPPRRGADRSGRRARGSPGRPSTWTWTTWSRSSAWRSPRSRPWVSSTARTRTPLHRWIS